MAARPPGGQKKKIEALIDATVYDEFSKACSKKGYAQHIILEQLIKKYNQTGTV